MSWEDDEDFVQWLESEGYTEGEDALDDEVIELMYRAWLAALEL